MSLFLMVAALLPLRCLPLRATSAAGGAGSRAASFMLIRAAVWKPAAQSGDAHEAER
jgi:hypothetical protein